MKKVEHLLYKEEGDSFASIGHQRIEYKNMSTVLRETEGEYKYKVLIPFQKPRMQYIYLDFDNFILKGEKVLWFRDVNFDYMFEILKKYYNVYKPPDYILQVSKETIAEYFRTPEVFYAKYELKTNQKYD